LSDADSLLRKCRLGDEEALSLIVRRYEKPFYRLALRICGDSALAEDAATESFFKIWKSAHQWRGNANPESWMYSIVTRTAIDLYRKQARWRNRATPCTLDHEVDQGPAPDDQSLDKEQRINLRKTLDQAIESLSPADRALVYLYYFEDQPLKEIASILEVNHDALKMRLSRTRQRLKKHLEADDVFPPT
jgi:RNA polymerase sigma-70 factor (ECF subfamily)